MAAFEKQLLGIFIMCIGVVLILIHPNVKSVPINIEVFGKFRYQGSVGGLLAILGALYAMGII